jgi:hypothetical protein
VRQGSHRAEQHPGLQPSVVDPDRGRPGRFESGDVRQVVPHIVDGGRQPYRDLQPAPNVARLADRVEIGPYVAPMMRRIRPSSV